MERIEDCPNFLTCSANLCPLDPDLKAKASPTMNMKLSRQVLAQKIWYIGEEACSNRAFQHEPMIKRQKKLNKQKPKTLMDEPLDAGYLKETAPKARTLSPEHKRKLAEASRAHRFGSGAENPKRQRVVGEP